METTIPNRPVTIKFYGFMVFEGHPKVKEMGYMFRSIDVVVDSVQIVSKLFQGEVKYDGDGSESMQYDDVVYFKHLSEDDEQWILKNYLFARKKVNIFML